MCGTDLGCQAVDGQAAVVRLQPFLQRRLVVFGEGRVRASPAGLGDKALELALDEGASGIDAAVEIDRGNKCFVAVGDERQLLTASSLLLAAAENQMLAE